MNLYGNQYRKHDVWERFISYIEIDHGRCWLWKGQKNKDGYAIFSENGVKILASNWIMLEIYREIPPSHDIDHLCRVRCCVNPYHLEIVTHKENMLRGNTIAAIRTKQTHCIHGHEFTPENTRARKLDDTRHCKTCHRIWDKNYRNRMKNA